MDGEKQMGGIDKRVGRDVMVSENTWHLLKFRCHVNQIENYNKQPKMAVSFNATTFENFVSLHMELNN